MFLLLSVSFCVSFSEVLSKVACFKNSVLTRIFSGLVSLTLIFYLIIVFHLSVSMECSKPNRLFSGIVCINANDGRAKPPIQAKDLIIYSFNTVAYYTYSCSIPFILFINLWIASHCSNS